MIGPNTPVRDVVTAMLAHDALASDEYLARQRPSAAAALVEAAEVLRSEAFQLMLRDAPAFMAFKSSEPQPAVPADIFRRCIEAAMRGEIQVVRDVLSPLTLDLLCAIMSVSGRLSMSGKLRASASCALRRDVSTERPGGGSMLSESNL